MKLLTDRGIEIAVVILLSTTHLRKKSRKLGKAISSGLLLFLIPLHIYSMSGHLCDEGNAPIFIQFGFAAIGAALPWVLPSYPWITRLAIVPILLVGGGVASYLTATYHRDDITGNRSYSSGWFWHTPFTGQYPRDPAMTPERREAEHRRLIREFSGGEPDGESEPVSLERP